MKLPWRGREAELRERVERLEQALAARAREPDAPAERLRRATVLARSVGAAPDLREALEAVAAEARGLLGAALGTVWVADPVTGAVELVAARSASEDPVGLEGAPRRLTAGQGPVGRAIEQRRPHVSPALGAEPVPDLADWARRERLVCELAVPLLRGEESLGALAVAALTALLANTPHAELITTDAVFSMDGDIAPLAALTALATTHGARLLADDAHGFGVLGPNGRGSFEAQGVELASPVILMGTLGKAVGTFGAFVAGEAALIETLIQQARTYIYTTALPPAIAEATRAALKLVREGSSRREHLKTLIARFRAGAVQCGLRLASSDTPIQPVILGKSDAALAASRALRASGIWVPAIRPPTVAADSARLRITISAAHTAEHIDRLLEALAQLPRDGA